MAQAYQQFSPLAALGFVQQQGEIGRERGERNQLNQLASLAYAAPRSQRDSIGSQIAAINPDAAIAQKKAWAADDDSDQKELLGMARFIKAAPPEQQQRAYQNAVLPRLRARGMDAPDWTPETQGTIMQTVDSLISAFNGGKANNPYEGLPADIQSLQLLRDNPELAKLDTERRQASGMVPKLAQTSQGYGWATPGGGIQLAPLEGVAGQGIPAQQQAQAPQLFAALGQKYQIQPTSVRRTPERNQQVGGVANSYHLSGQAADWVVPAQQKAQFMADVRANGFEAIDEGDHIHIEPASQSAPSGAIAQPYQSPAEQQRLALAQASDARAQQQLGLAERAAERADRAEQRQIAANSVSGRTPNEGERNASGFYQRMVAANAEMKRLTDAGYDPTNLRDHLTVGSAVGNFLASEEGQQYNQAAMNWVRANLRKESGAAIGVDEARQEIRNYFPQPGDSPAVAQQKAKNRLVVEQAMLQAAGRAAPQQAAQDRPQSTAIPQRAIVRTGTSNGRKVIQYSDGSVEYGN